MPFTGIAGPAQMRVMTEALGIYCQEHRIVSQEDRDFVAETIVSLFFSGCTTTETLLQALQTGDRSLCQSRPKAGDHDSHA